MAAALLFTLPPFFDSLAIWVPFLFLLSLALKFWMEPEGLRLRSVVLKLLLVATAVTTAFFSYSSARGLEAGISLLVVLGVSKILEAHMARESRVMVTNWVDALFVWIFPFPRLHDLALSSDRVCLAPGCTDPVSSWSGTGAVWPPVARRANSSCRPRRLSSFSFSCFPESMLDSGLNCVPSVRQTPAFPIGFPLEVYAALVNSWKSLSRGVSWKQRSAVWSDVLARASHVALQRYRMASPVRAATEFFIFHARRHRSGGLPVPSANAKEIQQRITLAPNGARWMLHSTARSKLFRCMLARGDYLSSIQSIRKTRRYQVVSSEFSRSEITAKERSEALEVPASISPAVETWHTHGRCKIVTRAA